MCLEIWGAEHLQEAVVLVLEANRALSEQELANASVIRERFKLTA
jgi:hypothetical protein